MMKTIKTELPGQGRLRRLGRCRVSYEKGLRDEGK